MGVFWDYFRKTLRFPLIWKPGTLGAVAEGGADAVDQARLDIAWLRDQFIDRKCDDDHLAHFAESRGIVRAPSESEALFNQRIKDAYLWYLLGGRAAGMRQALIGYFGLSDVEVFNLRDEDPDRWAEFRLKLYGIAGDLLSRLDEVAWAANEIKPARSKLAGYRLHVNFETASLYKGIAVVSGLYSRVYPYGAGEIEKNLGTNQLIAHQTGIYSHIKPGE